MRSTFLPFARPDLQDAEIDAVVRVLRSGWITTGREALALEEEFAAMVGADHAVAVNSCTAALHLALEAAGVGPDDEVITSTYTFASSAEVIRYVGAKPVLVDIDPVSLNVDLDLLDAAITPRTAAIIAVHVAGIPLNLPRLYQIASAHGLSVIEDCAHALPALCEGRLLGANIDRHTYSGVRTHTTCFSFYATKTMTTGEGGMLCTDDPSIAMRARMMSLHGLSHDARTRYEKGGSWYYEILAPGFKYNLTDIAAAIGREQLRRLYTMRDRREEIAARYSEAFSGTSQVQIPFVPSWAESSWHLYPLGLDARRLTIDRGRFIEELRQRNIGTSVHFIPLHIHPYYRDTYGYAPDDYPVALAAYEREVSLPIYSTMNDSDVEDVIEAVTDVVEAFAER